MGFGLPSAIGAKVAAPEKIVVDIDGDASFSMTAMELATASQYNIGVKVIVLNNEFQGMVLQWQGTFRPPSYRFPSIISLSRPVLRCPLLSHWNDQSRLRRVSEGHARACYSL